MNRRSRRSYRSVAELEFQVRSNLNRDETRLSLSSGVPHSFAGRYTARMDRARESRTFAPLTRAGAPALCATCAACAIMLLGAGCQKALFSPDEERSQYDRYDAIRAQRAAPYQDDQFGNKKPNLRGRLLDND